MLFKPGDRVLFTGVNTGKATVAVSPVDPIEYPYVWIYFDEPYGEQRRIQGYASPNNLTLLDPEPTVPYNSNQLGDFPRRAEP